MTPPPNLNLKLRHERSATAISVGYWYSRMYQRPINWKISKDQNTYLFIACILWKYTCDFYELKDFQRLNFSTKSLVVCSPVKCCGTLKLLREKLHLENLHSWCLSLLWSRQLDKPCHRRRWKRKKISAGKNDKKLEHHMPCHRRHWKEWYKVNDLTNAKFG